MTTPLKILLLGDHRSAHIQKWAVAMSKKGIKVFIFSLSTGSTLLYDSEKIDVCTCNVSEKKFNQNIFYKFSYLRFIPSLISYIKKVNPHIVHAHYATSYGLLALLSGFKPFIISVWGSDILGKHKALSPSTIILKKILRNAAFVCATSKVLKEAVNSLCKTNCSVIAFGIDIIKFNGGHPKNSTKITIGTIKSLEYIYGIDVLINAFKSIIQSGFDAELLLVGDGTQKAALQKLVNTLELNDKVKFTGKVTHHQVVSYHQAIDIFVNVSRNESFGVSVLESMACCRPVVVSNIGGLPEIVTNNETGIIVEKENVKQTADAIQYLLSDVNLRARLGNQARKFVEVNFSLDKSVKEQLEVYEKVLNEIKIK